MTQDFSLFPGSSLFVTKSTVPVGTGDTVEEIIREANPNADFAVVSNPEFLREGAAIEDFKRPDRVVVGTENSTRRAGNNSKMQIALTQLLQIFKTRDQK